MNRAIILGNLGKNPETRAAKNGTAVTNFSVATSKKINGETLTAWHNVVCFGKTAEICEKWLTKGSKVLIEGELSYSEWTDKDGVKKYKTEIVANNVEFIGEKKSDGRPDAPKVTADDGTIPF